MEELKPQFIFIDFRYALEILDDLTIENRWFLGEVNLPEEYHIWDFVTVSEIPVIQEPLAIEVSQDGDQLRIKTVFEKMGLKGIKFKQV